MVDKKVNEKLSAAGPVVTPPRVNEDVMIQNSGNSGMVDRVGSNQTFPNVNEELQMMNGMNW